MKISYQKLRENAVEPYFATEHAAAMDICAAEDTVVEPLTPALIPTGLAIELPVGYVGILALRSSSPKKKGLFSPHGVGVIDADYRGEWFVQVCALKERVEIKAGERIAQVIVQPARTVNGQHLEGMVEVESLSDTNRATGGFGSTG